MSTQPAFLAGGLRDSQLHCMTKAAPGSTEDFVAPWPACRFQLDSHSVFRMWNRLIPIAVMLVDAESLQTLPLVTQTV